MWEGRVLTASRLSLQNKISDGAQPLGGPAQTFQRSASRLVNVTQVFARGLDSVECRVSCLFRAQVLARSFAEGFGSGGDVKQIVRDLKKKTKLSGVFGYSREFGLRGFGNDGAALGC